MSSHTQFRHYLISQDASGTNIEVVRTAEQVGVIAFDTQRLCFVHCHVLMEPLRNRRAFDERGAKLQQHGHPLLARLVEFGEDDGNPYYITENVDGESLQSYLSRMDELPVWLAITITVAALRAVEATLQVGDFVPADPLDTLRILQNGRMRLSVMMADFRRVDAVNAKGPKGRLVKSSFEKQTQFLQAFFTEHLSQGTVVQEPVLPAGDFLELLQKMLSSVAPGLEQTLETLTKALVEMCPPLPSGELAAQYKPKPLLAPFLATFQEIARSVVQSIRIQSQKLDAGNPYAMRGMFLKAGQNVVVEQVPPHRMAGTQPGEALRVMQAVPKAGKYPNLVPVVFQESHEEIECVAETAVEGVSLGELLAERGRLEVQEIYLVMAGLDASLAQLEKAGIGTKKLRLEDIFLFTGFSRENAGTPNLLDTKLNDWPGFSVVLRAHPGLHGMACRGTDPGILLPVSLKAKPDVELIWNGGWMAALGHFLISGTQDKRPDDTQSETFCRLIDDELANAKNGNASARAPFLARCARVIREHDLAQPAEGFWQQLGGAASAQGRAAEVSRAAAPAAGKSQKQAPIRAILPIAAAPEVTERADIGFAELLIAPTVENFDEDEGPLPGLRQLLPSGSGDDYEPESSWDPLHDEMPFWLSATLTFTASLILGAVLAHFSGRAVWQVHEPVKTPVPATATVTPPVVVPEPAVKKTPSPPPVPKSTKKEEPIKLAPPAKSALADLDLEASMKKAPPAVQQSAPTAKPQPSAESEALSAKLRELRKAGSPLPQDMRTQVEKAAEQGNAEAMTALGKMFLRGENVSVDEKTAFSWLDKAARQGDTSSFAPLAECYLQGWGTPADAPKAVELLNKASSSGDPIAKDLLAVCYARKLGVERDDAKAFALSNEAYKAGVTSACGTLGALYLRGQGAPKDEIMAAQLFAEGAKRGHSDSMLLYAQCIERGEGVSVDMKIATLWYQSAARRGNAEAIQWCRTKGVTY